MITEAEFLLECELAETIHGSLPPGTCIPIKEGDTATSLCFQAARAIIHHYKQNPHLWTDVNET